MTVTTHPLQAHDDPDTMDVRVILPNGSAHYFQYRDVSPTRAIELARMCCAARCITPERYEVRPDIYPRLCQLPILTAPAFARHTFD